MTHCTTAKQIALIFGGADPVKHTVIKQKIDVLMENEACEKTIICADHGLALANKLAIKPHIVTGDFDSVCPDLLARYKQIDGVSIRHNEDQNSTDLSKAIALAPDTAEEIHIYGAWGGRPDHLIGNLLGFLNHPRRHQLVFHDENSIIRLLDRDHHFHGMQGDYVGIFPIQHIRNLRYDGLKYTPDMLDGVHELGWIGACNVLVAEKAAIYIDSGLAIFTHTTVSE